MENSTTTKTIDARVKQIMRDKFGWEHLTIPDDAHFSDQLGIDSLDQYEFLMQIEKEFSISIPEEIAEKIVNTGQLVSFIEKSKNGE